MEIVNSKQINKFVIYTSAISLILISVPILIYLDKFNGDFSNTPQDWGIFGDFIGGVIGVFLGLLSIIFSLIGIYITLKIATHIHNIETQNNIDSINREREKFNKETDLICKQYKPYPYIDNNMGPDMNEVILSNQGPGTLIVTSWHIIHENQNYATFIDLILSKFPEKEYDKIFVTWEKCNRITIASGAEKTLFESLKEKNLECDYAKFNKGCEKLFSECEILIGYEDIFETKYNIQEKINL